MLEPKSWLSGKEHVLYSCFGYMRPGFNLYTTHDPLSIVRYGQKPLKLNKRNNKYICMHIKSL